MTATSSYLDHLPASFRRDGFLGRFLLAFESVLSTSGDPERPGLEERIAGLVRCLDPATADPEFLPWLASWVGLTLRADWDVPTRRAFIQEIVPLYRRRGTLGGLRRMLEIYLAPPDATAAGRVAVFDRFPDRPHYFQVELSLHDTARLRETEETARAIVDREKPAHTYYGLRVVLPTMRLVSERLRAAEGGRPDPLILGTNSTLGTAAPPDPEGGNP